MAVDKPDGVRRIWHLLGGDARIESTILRGKSPGGENVVFSANGRWMVTRDTNELHIWDVQLDSLLAKARRIAGRELTTSERKVYQIDLDDSAGRTDGARRNGTSQESPDGNR